MTQAANKNQLSRILHCALSWCAVFALTICSVPLATAQKNVNQNLGAVTTVFIVTTLADSGEGSFREAIIAANAVSPASGIVEIRFAVTGTINLVTPLPAITRSVVINNLIPDGTASTPDTPTIELNGQATQNAGSASIGLWIRAGFSLIKGFAINRFGEAGIRMDTDGVGYDNENLIRSSHIGTNLAGDTALGNINRGILIVGTTQHFIGGDPQFDRNVISGNQGRGIEITAGGWAAVSGNYIGTNAAGTGDLGNTSDGVQIVNSSGSTIGYLDDLNVNGNVISGNNGHGVSILTDISVPPFQPASNNAVRGNYIGVNAAGTAALGNNGSGVSIQASNNTVGGATTLLRNVISGNRANGVSIGTTLATGNVVAGNYIGVDKNGTNAIANRNNGIQVSNTAAGNTIGGAGVTPGACDNSCNVIANNGDANSLSARAGVYVDPTAGVGNTIQGNSIFNNAGIGIDLGTPGSTANDAGDPDTGPNNLQNFPVITSALSSGNVTGTLNSTPNTTFRIDFYSNAGADAANSEGRTYIGFTTTTTDGGGNAVFGFNSAPALSAGQFITATATTTAGSAQAIGDTSEFSGQALVTAAGGGFSISGKVNYGVPSNNPAKPVANVQVTAVGPTTESDMTDPTGNYQLDNLVPGGTYIVTPSKSGDVNGITPFDATMILRHVVSNGTGPNALNANQRIAADTNGDGSITPFDATLILRYIVSNGSNANTGQVGTWKFVPPNRTYSPLLGPQTGQDYEAILVGDVNGDWMPATPQNRQKAKSETGSQMQLSPATILRLNVPGYFSPN